MGILIAWLGRPGAMKILRAARDLLETAAPLKVNCGRLCERACCQSDATGENGMLLFPYEEFLYQRIIEGFPYRLVPDESVRSGGVRLVCEGHCLRERRPLACRLFPLRLRVLFDEPEAHPTANPEIDPRAWALCPLVEQRRLSVLNPAFVTAVKAAGTLLVKNLYHLEFLVREQAVLDEARRL